MNTELDKLYLELLKLGFIVLKQALRTENIEWATAEVELLHSIPSLVGEENLLRHKYFWEGERDLYLQRIVSLGNLEASSRSKTFYEPIFERMAVIIAEFEQAG